ncbi:uncharacterized protein A4U43_C04F14150 [Asparagus officinalis]|uniref:Uncharacterized protein n=1 Tax=Asparagus officinalis TaxID=4686 RepID=A0A5P1F0R8_ASPOF|nr:uncharacterized protein A4U43_C04F14150 [Asparagus officinalis]
MEWPQQVIYWKSIAAMNQALRHENENKFKGMIAADCVKISALSVKVAKLSAQNRRLGEELREVPPPEAYRIDKALEAEINEREKVSPPAKELLTCTETGTQCEGTGREITPAVDVPYAGHNTEMQTCIDTLREDTGMEIKQSENAPPPAIETSTDDEDAPIVFSRDLNKRKRGARGAREKVAAAAPLKWKRCKRTVKPSKWIVTPYTEGKKKKEKNNIGDKAIIEVVGEEEEQVQENVAELAPARLQSDPHSIWEKHMSSLMSSEEEMYRNKLNEGIPFPEGFIIKFLGDKDTFVHNYKQSVKFMESSLEKAIAIQAHLMELRKNNNGE